MITITIHISLFLMISFWAYCNLFYERQALPYVHGYIIFAIFQWIILGTNLIHFYGWVIGIISLVILIAFGAIIITNFTTNQIYRFIFGLEDPTIPLALFAIFVPINAVLTGIVLFLQ